MSKEVTRILMKCRICETRKPRRECAGIGASICSICCGNEREVTVNCPSSCHYLRESRPREKLVETDPKSWPNADIDITDRFLEEHRELMIYVGFGLNRSIVAAPGVVDQDVREALDSLTNTYRTMNSGLVYDDRPVNPYAAGIVDEMRRGLDEYHQDFERQGVTPPRTAEILGCLVTYQRMAVHYHTGRPKSRYYIDFLADQFRGDEKLPTSETTPPSSPLVTL